MEGYKHYIRVDDNDIVIHRFSDAFEQPQEGDICIAENAGRHYNEPYINGRGQFLYKWDGSQQVERSQEELDAEWAARPPEPPSDKERIEALEAALLEVILQNG